MNREVKFLQHITDYYDRLIPIEERKKGVEFKHDRYSKSSEGVLRGLHYDDKTWKLVSCIHGKIYLVVLDVRDDNVTKNPQYGSWETYILSPQTQTQVLIPPGFYKRTLCDGEGFYFPIQTCISR